MRSLTYECRRVWAYECRRVWVRASKSSRSFFYDLSFLVIAITRFFIFLRNYYTFSYFLLFYFTRTMKIITDCHCRVLTEESPSTMDDNNKLTVFAGYYIRCLFPLPAFLNGVAGIHPGLINLKEIKTIVLEFFWHT